MKSLQMLYFMVTRFIYYVQKRQYHKCLRHNQPKIIENIVLDNVGFIPKLQ